MVTASDKPDIKKIEHFRWTCDCEMDFGGRVQNILGMKHGLPIILDLFKANEIKALFFISTEILRYCREEIVSIIEAGHELGSHGHFHTLVKSWRSIEDRILSEELLFSLTGKYPRFFRAPKFSSFRDSYVYANPRNHVGLLKQLWFRMPIPSDPIFYLHPFDIVGGSNAPNLFCKVWYSRPKEALELFEKLVSKYK